MPLKPAGELAQELILFFFYQEERQNVIHHRLSYQIPQGNSDTHKKEGC